MTTQNWRLIQRWAGVDDDGNPGPATARAIIARAGIERDTSLVTGDGKDIKRIFIHCTATREGQDFSASTIRKWHKRKGWSDIGYHFVVGIDGEIEAGRPESRIGSHVRGFNKGSIGVVYVGGLDAQGQPKDTRTPEQTAALHKLVTALEKTYPGAKVMGHRDASPDKDGDGVVEEHEWLKACPCFDVKTWWYGS